MATIQERFNEFVKEIYSILDTIKLEKQILAYAPKFVVGQKVWKLKSDYNGAFKSWDINSESTVDSLIEEANIKEVVFKNEREHNYLSPIVVVYRFNGYYANDNTYNEKDVYATKDEIIAAITPEFERKLSEWKKDKEEKIRIETENLRRRLSELEKQDKNNPPATKQTL